MSLVFRTSTVENHARTVESWIEELNFYETEIGSCELSLEHFIEEMHQQPERLAAAERFQNQFIHQREVINELKFKVRQYLRALPSGEDKEVDRSLLEYFDRISEEVNTFRKLFNELLLGFDDFSKHYS